jgi:hypothetical protein
VLFSQTMPPVLLSTAPWLPPTHWGQALWVLPIDMDAAPGQEVTGTFTQTAVAPSTASFRADVRVGGGAKEKAPVSPQPSNDGKPTARRAIKSFSGGPGGRFFKKAPLAGEGNNSIDVTLAGLTIEASPSTMNLSGDSENRTAARAGRLNSVLISRWGPWGTSSVVSSK